MLGAFTLYMLLRKPHRKLISKGWNKTLATSFLLAITILIVFVIGGAFLGTVYNKVKDFQPQIIHDNLANIHDVILDKTGYNVFSKDIADKALQTATKMLPNIFATTGSIVTNSLMMIFLLFFMLQESKTMESSIENNLPLSRGSISLLKQETQNMVVSNTIGIPIILIGQGLVAALGYWIFDAGDPFVWGVLTGIFGLIPIIGTAGIWLPIAINLIIDGNVLSGGLLIVYGALVISSVDNLIRIVFLKRYANVHPLITIFGIILGMNLFGFWGIIFGPLMISGLIVLFKIYKSEFLID
jgi:predicted PurR-regulated permease PerM